jgi:hypothetical protein
MVHQCVILDHGIHWKSISICLYVGEVDYDTLRIGVGHIVRSLTGNNALAVVTGRNLCFFVSLSVIAKILLGLGARALL